MKLEAAFLLGEVPEEKGGRFKWPKEQ
jgi:hypothetical protein